MMEAVIVAIKNGNFPDEELQRLKDGMEKLGQTEAYEDYGTPFKLGVWRPKNSDVKRHTVFSVC